MLTEFISLEVSSNPKMCALVRACVNKSCSMVGFCDDEINMITLAIDEAFANIIRHTYKMDCEGKIRLVIAIHEKSHFEITLTDYGPTIDSSCMKGRDLEDIRPGGLGLHFMESIMDVVEHIPQSDGNVLRMVKYINEGTRSQELLQTLKKALPKLTKTARMRKELESARVMHEANLPKEIPKVPGLEISAICRPCEKIGGDYYDVLYLTEDTYGFAIGDLSGHGLEAGMQISQARCALYSQINQSKRLVDVMKAMNAMVYDCTQSRIMMTFFFAIYDIDSRVLSFSNAGHPNPYYYSGQNKRWQMIEEGEFPLGIYQDHTYETHICQLFPGDFFILYSDGIVESTNQQGERYGFDRFTKLLQSEEWSSAKKIQDTILKDVEQFSQKFICDDDLTLLVLYVKSDAEKV